MATLQRAIEIAVKAHAEQVDKAGLPYILHPLRMMEKQTTLKGKIVAVLHDVVEDTDLELDDLRTAGFDEEIVLCVDNLTRRKKPDGTKEVYLTEFIPRAKSHPISRQVKLDDIADNMDITRIDSLSEDDLGRLRRYHRARKILLED